MHHHRTSVHDVNFVSVKKTSFQNPDVCYYHENSFDAVSIHPLDRNTKKNSYIIITRVMSQNVSVYKDIDLV